MSSPTSAGIQRISQLASYRSTHVVGSTADRSCRPLLLSLDSHGYLPGLRQGKISLSASFLNQNFGGHFPGFGADLPGALEAHLLGLGHRNSGRSSQHAGSNVPDSEPSAEQGAWNCQSICRVGQ